MRATAKAMRLLQQGICIWKVPWPSRDVWKSNWKVQQMQQVHLPSWYANALANRLVCNVPGWKCSQRWDRKDESHGRVAKVLREGRIRALKSQVVTGGGRKEGSRRSKEARDEVFVAVIRVTEIKCRQHDGHRLELLYVKFVSSESNRTKLEREIWRRNEC